MKLLKKSIAVLFVVSMMLSVAATSHSANALTYKYKKTLYAGQSVTLKIYGTSKKVSWKSSNKKIATVKYKSKYVGKVTAKRNGAVTITAKFGKKKLYARITVKKVPGSYGSFDTTEAYNCYTLINKRHMSSMYYDLNHKGYYNSSFMEDTTLKATAQKAALNYSKGIKPSVSTTQACFFMASNSYRTLETGNSFANYCTTNATCYKYMTSYIMTKCAVACYVYKKFNISSKKYVATRYWVVYFQL